MEITKSIFADQLPEIKEAIDNATFLSIDCELTGLNTTFDITAFDTQKQYFEKIYNNSKDFLVIQFGVSAFRYIKETKSFKHKTYTFYIFPHRMNRMMPDQRFLCQASSIDFLINQGFDFNKMFKEGIPYLNKESEEVYRETLEESRSVRSSKNVLPQKTQCEITIPAVQKPFVDKVFGEIEEFLISDEKERVLPKCNAFLRRLIYQTANGRIGDQVHLETRFGAHNERLLVVSREKTAAERSKDEEDKIEEENQVLHHAIGFSKLVQYISESRKLVVGHNMMLDVCHTIDKFLTHLPDDYESFKECVHCLFPKVLDTKYMASVTLFKDLIPSSVLGQMFTAVCKSPFKLPLNEAEDGSPSYSCDNPKEHEAGYDAYITGLSFISMWQYLIKHQKYIEFATFESMHVLKPYINRLYLMRVQDSPYIQLDGPDPKPSREHVFYITYPREWKLNDITQLFHPYGNVYVAWIDETSAYVAMGKTDSGLNATTFGTLMQGTSCKIMTYDQRQLQLEANAEKVQRERERFRSKRDAFPNASVKKHKPNFTIDTTTSGNKLKARKNKTVSESGDKDDDSFSETEPVPCLIKPRKRTISKTFAEDNSWE